MKIVIKSLNLEVVLLCLTFYEPTVVPHYIFLIYKYIVLLFLFGKYLKNIFSDKLIYAAIFFYGGVTILSTAINRLPSNMIVSSTFYMIQIIDIFILLQSYLKKHTLRELTKCICIIFLCICILTDILMVFIHYDFVDAAEEYFIGNKFVVSYIHCFTLTILYSLSSTKNHNFSIFQYIKIIAFAILSMLICIKVTCTTGIIGILAVALLLLLPKTKMGIFMSDKMIIIVTLTMNILIFGSYNILTVPVLQDVIINVFHKNASLTGRLPIYRMLISTIQKSPLIGYGYFNNIVENVLDYGNAQNGIMKILLDSGLLGLIGYVGIVIFGLNKKKKEQEIYWPFFTFLYAMIIMSAVEINLTHMLVFLTVALIFANSEELKISGRRI